MAGKTITIEITANTEDFRREIRSATEQGSRDMKQFNSAIDATNSGLNTLRLGAIALGAAAIGIFKQIGESALDAAKSINQQVSALQALTGSAAAAKARFQELFAIAQKTPGLTTSLATTLDA